MPKSHERASHAFEADIRSMSEGQFENLGEIIEKSGLSGENAKIAKAVIESRKESYMDAGLDVPERIKTDLAKLEELSSQWDDDMAIVSKSLAGDTRLKPYLAEDLEPIIDMDKIQILSSAMESGNLHQMLEGSFVRAAEEQRAEKTKQEETEMWSESTKAKDFETAEDIAARTKAEMAAMETGDEEAFTVDADQSAAEALAKTKQYQGLQPSKKEDFGNEQDQDADTPAGPAYRETAKAARTGILGTIAGIFRRR